MYTTGDSVVAGLVPATSRRCCGRVSIHLRDQRKRIRLF